MGVEPKREQYHGLPRVCAPGEGRWEKGNRIQGEGPDGAKDRKGVWRELAL